MYKFCFFHSGPRFHARQKEIDHVIQKKLAMFTFAAIVCYCVPALGQKVYWAERYTEKLYRELYHRYDWTSGWHVTEIELTVL